MRRYLTFFLILAGFVSLLTCVVGSLLGLITAPSNGADIQAWLFFGGVGLILAAAFISPNLKYKP